MHLNFVVINSTFTTIYMMIIVKSIQTNFICWYMVIHAKKVGFISLTTLKQMDVFLNTHDLFIISNILNMYCTFHVINKVGLKCRHSKQDTSIPF